MGWHKSPDGERGFFSDDQCVPQDWTPATAPDVPAEPEKPAKVEKAPEKAEKPARKAKRK